MIYRMDIMNSRDVARWSAVVTAMVWALDDVVDVPVCNVVAYVTCGHWGKGKVEPIGSGIPVLYAADMEVARRSSRLKRLAREHGSVEFAVLRHPNTGKADIYVQAKLAI